MFRHIFRVIRIFKTRKVPERGGQSSCLSPSLSHGFEPPSFPPSVVRRPRARNLAPMSYALCTSDPGHTSEPRPASIEHSRRLPRPWAAVLASSRSEQAEMGHTSRRLWEWRRLLGLHIKVEKVWGGWVVVLVVHGMLRWDGWCWPAVQPATRRGRC